MSYPFIQYDKNRKFQLWVTKWKCEVESGNRAMWHKSKPKYSCSIANTHYTF